MSESVKNTKKTGKNLWKPGVSANPNGRPKGSLNKATQFQQELHEALELCKKDKNKSFLQHFVERGFKSDTVAIALSKKILPDKSETEVVGEQKIVIVRANEVK